jgi:hypothetical protein
VSNLVHICSSRLQIVHPLIFSALLLDMHATGHIIVMGVLMFPTPLELQNELMKSFLSVGNADPTPFDERGTFKRGEGDMLFVPVGADGRSLFANSEIQEGEAGTGGKVDH